MEQGIFIFVVFFIALFMNIPVAFSLGIASVATIIFFDTLPLGYVIQAFFSSGDSFPLLAVPFFILAGDIMMQGGISSRLINFCKSLMGTKRGGLGVITVFASMIFASISGSGPATVAAIGGLLIPAMINEGYDRGYACSLGATAGALGPIVPPSISFVVYGVIAQVSITELFIAGVVPGTLMAIALVIFVKITSNKHEFGVVREKATFREKIVAFKEAIWALMVPVIILGGIYGGIITPTEAAIIACVYGIIVGLFIYKEITLKDLPNIFAKSALTSGTVLVLIGCATAFGRILAVQHIPTMIAEAILGLTDSKILILLLINVVLFITGMFMETLAAIVILGPLLLSVVNPLGINPVHFGMIMVLNLVIGQCTPPVGVNLYVAARVGSIKFERMFKWLIPLIIVLLVVQMLITFIPGLSLVLVDLLT
ncbi:MAG: TRAP transporter large permease [Peptococcales bacterium]